MKEASPLNTPLSKIQPPNFLINESQRGVLLPINKPISNPKIPAMVIFPSSGFCSMVLFTCCGIPAKIKFFTYLGEVFKTSAAR